MGKTQHSIRVEGVVLRYLEYGEADRIVTLYTRQLGKIRAIVKGARKIRSRKAGHLDLFTHVQLQLSTGRDLFIVTQAEALHTFPKLREDLTILAQASYVVELVDKFTYDEEENAATYRLLVDTLERLTIHDQQIPLVIRYYEMRLLDFMGFRPELKICVSNGEEITYQDQYFSSMQGGVICPECSANFEGLRPISKDALRYIRHLQRSSFQDALKARPEDKIFSEMETILQQYITFLLEKGLNSPVFLRRLRQDTETTPHSPSAA
ncbi:MAG: DNA repair protein RecO [Anaerolineales bacterium]|nr:DNA repair protein RecO [Anaerolineales bacterium]